MFDIFSLSAKILAASSVAQKEKDNIRRSPGLGIKTSICMEADEKVCTILPGYLHPSFQGMNNLLSGKKGWNSLSWLMRWVKLWPTANTISFSIVFRGPMAPGSSRHVQIDHYDLAPLRLISFCFCLSSCSFFSSTRSTKSMTRRFGLSW